MPLRILGHEAFRKSIGVVMQNDQLLSGPIAENICFFDESFELEHMMHCAELAGIHEEIRRMPMAYKSLIGDMGTSLSGGQKQRVLLAAAPLVHGRGHLASRHRHPAPGHRRSEGAQAGPGDHRAPAGDDRLGATPAGAARRRTARTTREPPGRVTEGTTKR